MNFSYKPYGLLVTLFSCPPGWEVEFLEEHVSKFVKKYKDDLMSVSRRYFGIGPVSRDFYKYYAPLYEPFFYSALGNYDAALVMMVDSFEIIDRLSHLDFGAPQHFIYGPIPDLSEQMATLDHEVQEDVLKHPQFSETHIFDYIKSYNQRLPLLSICQLKINNFANMDYGLEMTNAVTLKAFSHLHSCTGFEFTDGKVEFTGNNCKIIVFHSLSWNEVVLLVFGDSYSNMYQFIMDFRESYQDAFKPSEDQGIERCLIKKYTSSKEVPKVIRTHAFSATYTVHLFSLEIQKAVQEESGESSSIPRLPDLPKLDHPIIPVTFANVKPGHFSAASKSSLPTFHSLPGEERSFSIKFGIAGKADFLIAADCPFYINPDICNHPTQHMGCPNTCLHIGNINHCLAKNPSHFLSLLSTRDALISICRTRFTTRGECPFDKPEFGEVDLGKGTDIYRTWTSILSPALIEDQPVAPEHLFSQRIIQSKANGFSFEEVDRLCNGLKQWGFPRALIGEIDNVFVLYSSCVRDPVLFDMFIDLYPFMMTFYMGLGELFREPIEGIYSQSGKQRALLLKRAEWAKEAIDYAQLAISCRMEAGYLRNELMDANPFYKGGCQDILTIIGGLYQGVMSLSGSFDEQGALVIVSNEVNISSYNIGGGVVVECDAQRLFQPEYLVDIFHEAGHHLLTTEEYQDVKEELQRFFIKTQCHNGSISSKDIYDALEDAFSDTILLLYGFLGDFDLFSRHYWSSYYCSFTTYCATDHEYYKTLSMQTLRFMFVLLLLHKEFSDTEWSLETFDVLLEKAINYGERAHPEEIGYLRGRSTHEYNNMKVWASSNGSMELNAAIACIRRILIDKYNMVYPETGNTSRKVALRCEEQRRFAFAVNAPIDPNNIFTNLSVGKPVNYALGHQPVNTSPKFQCLEHLGCLCYAFSRLTYEKMGDEKPDQYLRHDDKGWPSPKHKKNPPLMRYPVVGGYFVTGTTERGEHFRSRLAFLMSLWDVAIKEKRYLVKHSLITRHEAF